MSTIVLAMLFARSPAWAQTAEAFAAKIPAAGFPSSVTLSTSAVGGLPGYRANVPVILANSGSIAPVSFQIDLLFNPQVLTYLSASGVAGFSAELVASGDLRLSAAAGSAIANGVVASVWFVVGSEFQATTPLTAVNCASTGAGGMPLSTGCTSGSIITYTCAVTGDGTVSVADVQSLVNQALGLAPPVNDLDQDGAITVADVQKVIDAAVGMGCVY